jgi:hypothetical protein
MDVQSFVNQQQQTRDRMRWVVIQDGHLAIRIAGQTQFRWSPQPGDSDIHYLLVQLSGSQ